MADASCTSFGSKSITSFSHLIPHYIPSKPFLPFSTLSFHHSNLAKRTRSRRKKLHLTCLCTPNSPYFDVISTHECSDGSLVFRFGNLSEVVKNDQLSETNLENEEMEGDDDDDFKVVKVLDGDHKSEVIVKKIDGEVKNNDSIEVVDEADSAAVSSESNSVVEKENSSSEMLSSSSIKVEMPLPVSSIELNDSSELIVEVEDAVLVEKSVEENDSSESVVELEDVVHVEESPIENDGDESSAVLNSSSEMLSSSSIKVEMPVSVSSIEVNDSSGSIVEIEDAVHVEESIEMNDSSKSVVEVEDVVHVEESPIEKDRDESLAVLSSSALDHISGLEDNGESLETLEPIIDSTSLHESVSVKLEPVVEVFGDDDDQETSQENVAVVHSSTNADALNVEAGIQDAISVKSDIIGMTPLSPPSEAEPILDEEAGLDPTEESSETDNSENSIMINNSSKSVLEVERTKEIVESDELVDASTSEVLELKSTGSDLQSEEIPMAKLFLSSGASLLQNPQKALAGREDAYFTCQNWLGVADGVGQWSLEGINPGVYAKELMENCQKVVSDCNDVPITAPEEVLNLAVAKAHAPGSSTVLIAHFDGQALHVANIGDCGFIILRNDVVYQRSSPMLHEFNFPVQIERGDEPSKLIESYRIDLDERDIVVIATDGLFDNLYEQEIMSIVLKSLEADKNLEEIAKILAMRAQEMGSSTSTRTPFADAAQAAGYEGYTGGKPDDVAVIVSLVEKVSNSSAL